MADLLLLKAKRVQRKYTCKEWKAIAENLSVLTWIGQKDSCKGKVEAATVSACNILYFFGQGYLILISKKEEIWW